VQILEESDEVAEKISAALLKCRGIAESCVVKDTHRAEHVSYAVYVALLMPESLVSLVRRLVSLISPLEVDVRLYQVSTLPRRSDGEVDTETLRRLGSVNESGSLAAGSVERVSAETDFQVTSAADESAYVPQEAISSSNTNRSAAILDGGDFPDEPAVAYTLPEILLRAARHSPNRGVRFIEADGCETQVSYAELCAQAARLGASLTQSGLRPGERAVIAVAGLQSFLLYFWGCLFAGIVPVPCVAPTEATSAEAEKLLAIRALLSPVALLATERERTALAPLIAASPEGGPLLISEQLPPTSAAPPAARASDDTALMLMTSGSTGTPKLVMQTHGALMHYVCGATQYNRITADDVSLNWLPLDHVGGLVMFHLRDTWAACEQIHAATALALAKPLRWLEWIDRFRASMTWAPHFAFALLASETEQIGAARWDLSCMRFMMNAGERIVHEHVQRLVDLLAPQGLKGDAIRYAWGMSETCSVVIYARYSDSSQNDNDSDVSVGHPVSGCSMRIQRTNGTVAAEGEAGELLVRGPTVTRGYFRNEAATHATLTAEGWLRTGDTGVIRDGTLFVVGRTKDVLILNGLKYGSEEVESVAASIPGVRPTCVAAVALRPPGAATDHIALVFTPDESAASWRYAAIGEAISATVARRFGCARPLVFRVDVAAIPKTSTGKIMRARIRENLQTRLMHTWWRSGVERPALEVSAVPRELARVFDQMKEAGASGSRAAGRRVLVLGSSAQIARVSPFMESLGVSARYVCREASAFPQLLTSLDECAEVFFFLDEQHGLAESLLALHAVVRQLAHVHRSESLELSVIASTAPGALDHCALAAIGAWMRSVAAELPWLRLRLLSFPASLASSRDSSGLSQELRSQSADQAVLHTARGRYVPALTQPALELPTERIQRRGLYVITGGLGGIGTCLATHLMSQFSARLLLLGRTPVHKLSASSVQSLHRLQQLGTARYESVDVTDGDALARIVAETERDSGMQIAGIFHLAGVLKETKSAAETDFADIAGTLAPKVQGTQALAALLGERSRMLFVVFSSVTATFGGAGVSAHAAACAYQERIIETLAAEGAHDCFSIGWSSWESLGQSSGRSDSDLAKARGFTMLSAARALALLDFILTQSPGLWLAGLDFEQPAVAWRTARDPILIEQRSTTDDACSSDETSAEDATSKHVLSDLKLAWREILTVELVRDDDSFFGLGGHSLLVPRLIEHVNTRLGVSLKATDLFRHPTARALARHVASLQDHIPDRSPMYKDVG
jgi:acyl-CoA synthetase (AMP-forming)/AMP-acid ligase II/NADP-dependent 3-hydroxy acid dehydrogenase YdfG